MRTKTQLDKEWYFFICEVEEPAELNSTNFTTCKLSLNFTFFKVLKIKCH